MISRSRSVLLLQTDWLAILINGSIRSPYMYIYGIYNRSGERGGLLLYYTILHVHGMVAALWIWWVLLIRMFMILILILIL
ncbi:hypothetical protein DFH27DRAFT_541403, partial [Peziza echinospora]